jgi:ArsR family transcriptional regulator
MESEQIKLYEMQAEFCSVMANPKRLMIIDFLHRKGEASVGEIAEELQTTISLVSQHLRLMRNKNVVLSRKDGQTVPYRLKYPKLMEGCRAVQAVLLDELHAGAQMARSLGKLIDKQ